MIQPLPIGNALRLFIQPPAGAVRWKVLRKGSATFTGHDDPGAIVAYEGNEDVYVDTGPGLKNELKAFYCAFYTKDGAEWTASQVNDGTPAAIYEEHSTDVLSFMRERLEAGLKVECERGTFMTELGYIQVMTAPPAMDGDLRFPLVTIYLDDESSSQRAIGESMMGDELAGIGDDWEDSDGWLANVQLSIVGWSLNGDERVELRKAIRRLIVGNLQVFGDRGWMLPNLSQKDQDAVNGEYPTPMYQVLNTFTCLAPVRVSGGVSAISEVISRSVCG